MIGLGILVAGAVLAAEPGVASGQAMGARR